MGVKGAKVEPEVLAWVKRQVGSQRFVVGARGITKKDVEDTLERNEKFREFFNKRYPTGVDKNLKTCQNWLRSHQPKQ